MSHTFNFVCRECSPQQRFSVEREQADTNNIGKVFCPGCGKLWGSGAKIELDLSHLDVVIKNHGTLGKENEEASRHAQEAAMRDRVALDQIDPQVAPGIRKSQVDTINERMSNAVQSL